jgi:hypothetical protein
MSIIHIEWKSSYHAEIIFVNKNNGSTSFSSTEINKRVFLNEGFFSS